MKKFMQVLLSAGTNKKANKDWGKLPYVLMWFAHCLWPIAWLYSNQQKISFVQSTMARGICSIVFGYLGCLYSAQQNILCYQKNLKLLSIRSIIITFHSFCTGFAQFVLPLPVCYTISCSGILFVFIIDYFVNGTSINKKQIVGIVIGIIGVTLTSNGQLITTLIDPTYQYKSLYQNYLLTDPLLVVIFTFFYFLAVIGWAYSNVIIRLSNANTFQINFILGIFFYFFSNLLYPLMPSFNYQLSSFWTMLKVNLYTGIPCVIVQILMATALTMTKQTGVLNMMAYSMIFVSYLISIFRYNETPNLICLFGIILVIIGSAGTLLNINISKSNNK